MSNGSHRLVMSIMSIMSNPLRLNKSLSMLMCFYSFFPSVKLHLSKICVRLVDFKFGT